MQSRATPSGWYADPQGRFEYRYFNGVQWTADVAVDGQRYVDTLVDLPAPAQQPSGRPRGIAIASFTTALGAVLLGWVPFVFVLAAGAAITSIVFGMLGLKSARRHDGYGRNFAVAGLALSPVALAVCVGGFYFTKAVMHEFRDFVDPGPHEIFVDEPCTVDGGRATVRGTIHNLDSRDHDYRIVVEFASPTTSTSATASVRNVVPDATAPWTTSVAISGSAVKCTVTDVFGPMPFGVDQQS